MIQQSPTERADVQFLRDLAERLWQKATPAMGFDQNDTDQLYRIARDLASQAAQPAEADGWVKLDGNGWVYFNEDTGEEYAPDHPVRSGEVPDATCIRRSTGQEDHLHTEVQRLFAAATPKAPATDAGEVEILARQRSPIVADYDENYLVARVSSDGKQVGIDHPCDAVWSDVMLAHVALRDYINERIERQDACPFKTKALATPPAPNDDLRAENERLREALAAKPWPPTDDELRQMLGRIVGAWWSAATGREIQEGKRRLNPEDLKGMYAVRDVLAPYVARAALKENRRG